MAKTKTAVSLEESLFEQADAVAEEMEISRSRLFALAVEQFLARHEAKKMLEALNSTYQDEPDEAEQQLLREAKAKYRTRLEDTW